MKNIPEKIYLQIDADGETPDDFNRLHGVCWCAEKVFKNDLVYCHGDILEEIKRIRSFFRKESPLTKMMDELIERFDNPNTPTYK